MSNTETDRQPTRPPAHYWTLQLLHPRSDDGAATSWLINQASTPIGRDIAEDQGISLGGDHKVSSLHAELTRRGDIAAGQVVGIRDAGSKNGTYVNGKRISASALADGDVLRIGNSLLLLRLNALRVPDAPPDCRPLHTLLRGEAPALRATRAELWAAAPLTTPVLLCGESGTGKELAAHALHAVGGRSGPIVPVNCAAVPVTMAESQFFGHLGGAFTGASREARSGFFQAADGGTLFLDEVGDLPADLQPKLLRALETRTVLPLGATRAQPCDVRVVAATNRDLRAAMAEGRFRPDLYARLAGVVLEMPPLRARREDVLPLFAHFLETARRRRIPADARPLRLDARLAEALVLHPWPLNVRELLRCAELAESRNRGDASVDLPLLLDRLGPPIPVAAAAPTDPAHAVAVTPPLNREIIERLMAEHGGVVSRVALAAGRSRKHVRRLLEKFGIDREKYGQDQQGRKDTDDE